MKLIIDNLSLLDHYDAFQGICMAKEAGFDGISFDLYDFPCNDALFGDDYRAYAQKIRKCLEENNMVCHQTHGPYGAYGEPFDLSGDAFRKIVQAMEVTALLGAKCIVIHTIRIPETEKAVTFTQYNLTFMKALEPYAKQFGVFIALENLPDRDPAGKYIPGNFGTPQALAAMLKELDSDCFVVCVDTGHAALAGIAPPAFIHEIDPRKLKLLHIQDADDTEDKHDLPYLGSFDWDAIMKALKRVGYTGDFTYEITRFMRRFPKELYPQVLKLAAEVGRYLIEKFQNP